MRLAPISRTLLVGFGISALTLSALARPQTRFAASDTTALVRGTVVGPAGLPLAGVKVVATAKVFKTNPLRELLGSDSTLTSDSGTYVLPALDLNSPGFVGAGTAYYLTFAKAGYRQGTSSNLELMPGDTATSNIRLHKMIDLTVIVGKAGAPESSSVGAGIVLCAAPLMPRKGYLIGSVKGSGMYTFTDVDSGAKSITAELDGYKPAVVRRSMSEGLPKDSVRILLERSNPDSMRTLIVKVQNSIFPASKDTMVFSAGPDSLPMNLFAISDSGVFTFRDIPDAYASGLLTMRYYSDTTMLIGPITRKTFQFRDGGLSVSQGNGPVSGNGKIRETPGAVPYYFDGKSGKSFNVLGKPRAALSAPSSKP